MMKKHVISAIMAMLLLTSSISAIAYTDNRASLYLDSYMVLFVADGNGSMTINYGVYGTGKMVKIGAKKILVEEKSPSGKWFTTLTYTGSDKNGFFSYDAYAHDGEFSFDGIPGTTYRVTLTAYAGDSTGSDTRTLQSSERVCK